MVRTYHQWAPPLIYLRRARKREIERENERASEGEREKRKD